MLGKVGASVSGTNLIVYHRGADIFCQAAKPIHILSAIQKSCDLPTFLQ